MNDNENYQEMEELKRKLEEEEKEKEKKRRIIILLIILLLIIILLIMWKHCIKMPTATLGEKDVNPNYDNNTPTPAVYESGTPSPIENEGNTSSDDNNTTKTPQPMPQQTPELKPQPTAEPKPTQKPIEVNKEFIVTSNNKQWTEILNIFDNEKYSGMPIIYPGIQNTYYFEFTNTEDFDVECSINFREINKENIPIKYKLKENGIYIKGNENTYVNYNELNTKNIVVKANSQKLYELEWKWIDNTPNDNNYGDINKTITYSLEITVEAEQKI